MRWYPNRPQWITIWLTAAVAVSTLGQGNRRAAAAFLLAGALRAWSQARSSAKSVTAVGASTVLTVLVLLAAGVLVTPKPATSTAVPAQSGTPAKK